MYGGDNGELKRGKGEYRVVRMTRHMNNTVKESKGISNTLKIFVHI